MKDKTQSQYDARRSSLDYIASCYFQNLLTDSQLVDAYKAQGYSDQGAKRAAYYVINTGDAYRTQFKAAHPSLYY